MGGEVRLTTVVWRELNERKGQLATSFVAIILGVATLVAIKNVTVYSEKAVAVQLDALGANVLILPKSSSVQDYYAADMQGEEIPEEYVSRLMFSDLNGLDNLSPKLSLPVEVSGRHFVLTGILPKSEFQAKASWAGGGIFARPKGCGTVAGKPPPRESLVRKRVIETLAPREALLGADVAAKLGAKSGDSIQVLGESFEVTAVLPQTGTVDDSRIFAHLHSVQALAHKGEVVSAIEVVGCCQEISNGLVQKINDLLPEARVVTISQVVSTQIETNQMMSRLSVVFLGVVLVLGGAGIANYMYGNVRERRREVGMLTAMGAQPSFVLGLFLLKALIVGLAGGLAGYALGTGLAVSLGPRLAGIPVLPMPVLLLWALGLSVATALVASYFPARHAARLDPCDTLQEF